jgi:hypothetical protein
MTTAYSDRALVSDKVSNPLAWLILRRRRVLVSVHVDGREQDAFECSNAKALQSSLRPIIRHLPGDGAAIRFVGVEETSLPLGIWHVKQETDLDGLPDALSYLSGR